MRSRAGQGSPGSFGGSNAFDAVRRLLENSPTRHLSLEDFEPDLENSRPNRVEMVLIDRWDSDGDTCPECGGTGQYIGLNAVEMCKACTGLRLM